MRGRPHSKATRWARSTFLQGLGKKGSGFHGGIVGDDHAAAVFDDADSGDGAGGGYVAHFGIHVVACPEIDFEEAGLGIDEVIDAFAGDHASEAMLTVMAGFSPALTQFVGLGLHGIG